MRKILLNRVRKTYPNYKKHYALVDDGDFNKVNKHNWTVTKGKNTLYASTSINRVFTYMHTFVKGFKGIDHINGNGLNNQKKNLRKASHWQNNANTKSHCGNSKYKGVYYDKGRNKFEAYITFNRERIHLGRFDKEDDAGRAYNKMAKKLFGKYARPNIIARTRAHAFSELKVCQQQEKLLSEENRI